MMRPAAKAFVQAQAGNSVAPFLCDANAFADVLGISPAYRQKETFRWSCAMLMYKQMSSQDLTKNSDVSGVRSTITTPTKTDPSSSRQISISECPSPVQTFAVQKHKNFNFLKYKSSQSRGDQMPTSSTFSTSSELLQMKNADRSSNVQSSTNNEAVVLSPVIGNLFRSASSHDTRRLAGDSLQSLAINMNEASLNDLELEAIAAVHELQFAVKDIFVSELLPRTSDLIFLNITTAEGQPYCVELTKKGWRVTSLRHDCMNGDISNINLHVQYFETIYSMMDAISKLYRESFSRKLTDRLSELDDKNVDAVDDLRHSDASAAAVTLV